MNKLNSAILLFIIFVVSISVSLFSVSAIPELLIEVQPIDDHIEFDGSAKFNIELTNNREELMDITIPTPRNAWDITVSPYLLQLQPGESKTISISIAPPPTIKSGVYSVYFQFNVKGNNLDYKYLHVTIEDSSPVIEGKIQLIEEVKVQEFWSEEFPSKSYSVTILNNGNAEAIGSWETKVSKFDQFFLSSENHELQTDGEEVTIAWAYTIPVGEEVTYSYSISYLHLIVALILITIALFILGIYYMTRYSLIKMITHKRDGYIGVEIAVKNKTGKKQKNVIIEDYVPIPLMISREFGTMSPTAIRKKKDKLVLMWKFDELQPREERMLSYKMKSKLKVEGQIVIPPAVVSQKDGKKTIEIVSKVKK
jgi:hypothetical protein